MKTRTPWQVTRSVWYAMFMREAISRTMADRMAWFWMLAEPIAMMAVMVAMRSVLMGGQHIAGAEFIPWLLIGLLGFGLFREVMMRALGAIDSNTGLFAYRQVKPIDPVLVRSFLEGMLKTFILLLFIAGAALLSIGMVPKEPIAALFDWLSLWSLGVGAGLTLSALSGLIPEVARVVRIMSLPLLLLSGAMLPLSFVPHDYLQYLMLNPVVHGLESLRHSFMPSYRVLKGTDLTYLWFWALSLIALGLVLHIRYEERLKAR